MIGIQGITNVGNWLARYTAPSIQIGNREKFLREKSNHERLAAALIAAVATFRTEKVHIPGFLSSQNNSIDSVVVDANQKGAAIQVTSTWDDPRKPAHTSITELVWERIQQKHTHGKEYCEENHLCVFVGQQEYQNLDLEELNRRINGNPLFWNYWLIAPYGESHECRFLVCEVWVIDDPQQYECLVDFTPPDPIRINYFGNFRKGEGLASLVDLLKREGGTT